MNYQSSIAADLAGEYAHWLVRSQVPLKHVVQDSANDASMFAQMFRPMGDQVVLDVGRASALVKQGLSANTLDALVPLFGLERKEELLELLRVNASSLWRWEKDSKPLPEAQAEHILRVMSLSLLATTVFGSATKAWQWLKLTHPMLGFESPLAYASNEFAAQRVREVLIALRYGAAA